MVSGSILRPIIKVLADKCVNCHRCIAACPVKMCNDGSGEIVDHHSDLCVGCGECITACTHGARVGIDDFDDFMADVKKGVPMIAIVAPSAAASFKGLYLNLNGYLKSLGIKAVFDVSLGAELTVKSYVAHIKKAKPRMLIAQPCHTLVSFIEMYRPALIPYLAPADSPMMHTIKMIRRFYTEYRDHRIAVISPCYSKRREFDACGLGDYNVTFCSLEDYMDKEGIDVAHFPPTEYDNPPAERAVLFSSPGGLMRTVQRYDPDVMGHTRKIGGANEVYSYFAHLSEAIKMGNAPVFQLIDCLNCSMGCNGGPGTRNCSKHPDDVEYLVEKRQREARAKYQKGGRLRQRLGRKKLEKMLDKYWAPDLYGRSYVDRSSVFRKMVREPNKQQIDEIYVKLHKTEERHILNCGACGYRSCEQMAVAIFNNLNKPENCVHYVEAVTSEQNVAKSAFLARMSHEIRTPLNAILGLSEVELQNDLSGGARVNLEKIHGSGSLLLEIVNDILDISKIESGNFEIFPVGYEFPSLINDTVQLNIMRIGSKPIEFKLELDATTPSKLYGDEVRVKQILNNLLSNAFKYTDAGEVRLMVTWKQQGDNAWLTFTVTDTGRGIKKEDLEKLFSEYTQFDAAANRRIEGTGLGLSITKGLVEKMTGTITAESEYGKGSVFQVILPQGILDEKPVGGEVVENLRNFRFIEDRSRNRGASFIRSSMPYGKVLVVDDLQTNLDVMTGLLMPYGLTVDTATSGKEAVERIRTGNISYDVVFMDHMMPEMDGIETGKMIREIDSDYARNVPMIVLTANAISGNREMFLRHGFNDFISKPVDIKRLDVVLNQWIRDKQSAETLKEAETLTTNQKQGRNSVVSSENDEEGKWLLEHSVEGIDFVTALILYGNKGAAYMPILKSFVAHTPSLLERMVADLETSHADYVIEVHGLKGTCNAIGAAETGALARKLEFGMKEGNVEMVKSLNGELVEKARGLTEGLKRLLDEWDASRPVEHKESRTEPDRGLLKKLSEATAAFNSNETEEALGELEQYHYDKGEELVLWLREQADNFDYDGIHHRLEALLDDRDLTG